MNQGFPVAGRAEVRRALLRLLRAERPALAGMLVLYLVTAAAGVAAPLLLGVLIDRVRVGGGIDEVDVLAGLIVVSVLVQMALVRYSRYVGHRFGERALARLREEFVDRALRLPLSDVEKAGTGDLVTRNSLDVATVGTMLRDAIPEMFTAVINTLVILATVFVLDPVLGLCVFLMAPTVYLGSRWYLKRAREGYLAEGDANSAVTETLVATAEGARTMETFGLGPRRVAEGEAGIERAYRTRRWTLFLRSVLFPSLDASYPLPIAGILIIGGAMYFADAVTLGAVVAATLLVRQFVDPFDRILMWAEKLQLGAASYARVEGLGLVKGTPTGPGAVPDGDRLEAADVSYAYDGATDVLKGVTLDVRPGERLAIVGPSGAGKSTLGRLLAGIDVPRTGAVRLGSTPIGEIGPERLRTLVALVTQDHHVFRGTLRDNLALAKDADDEELRGALAAVEADWAANLPDGLDTELGTDRLDLDAAQAQQLALARVLLADPHTVILDEATSMLDPTAARRTEASLAAALEGRTVIAIAHRLHTAHDADRVAVIEEGRIVELGSHTELTAAGGPYSALWRSWHGD
ncbi:ABC transporter ATP-binding protein [Phytomonospora endophytica]|uniref:ATP-binding cassette subfamily C protein n=1 Tax=Phytomonospora endophytica TaxID=714109 RepID=A0A841G0H9_9ACTN|nr:ABC transporter ATP-binding protein [Phytomonospora endophytica]MBB6038189.1 ATP-binding cassette subfamily C protein [Phytomonospora endophytica]GIG67350.1 multidrug ABC transporter ATP-binding protein [Phytomonospora endophytica]